MRTRLTLLTMVAMLGLAGATHLTAAIYRAPGSLFTLTLPPGLATLQTVAARGDLVESRGYERRDLAGRVFLGVEIRRPPLRQDLAVHAAAWRTDRRSLPNVQAMTEQPVTYGGVPGIRLRYSFAYADDPLFVMRRDDVLFELDGHRVLVFAEAGSRDGGDPTALMDQVMPTLTTAAAPSSPPQEGLAERVVRLTAPQADPAPVPSPVVAEGTPPLTERTLAVWRQLLEWTAGADCTFAQERRLRRALVAVYEAGGEGRTELLDLEASLRPAEVVALPRRQADALRETLRERFRTMAGRSADLGPDASVFDDVLRDATTVVVRGSPPLTVQSREAALETLGFLLAVVTDGAGAGAGASVPPLSGARFALELRRQWLQLGRVTQTCLGDLPRTWNALRLAWETAPPPVREAAAERFRDRVRVLARRPGGPGDAGSATLLHRILTVVIDRPSVLATLADELAEALPGSVRTGAGPSTSSWSTMGP